MRPLALAVLAAAAAHGSTAAEVGAPAFVSWAVDEQTAGLLVADDRAPVVFVHIEFPAGTWSAWARDADLRTAMAIQLHDPQGELRRRADALAAEIRPWSGPRASGVVMSCLAEDLEPALELLREVLDNRSFDGAELGRRARQAKIEWQAAQRNVQLRGRQAAVRLLFEEDDPRRIAFDRPPRVETDPRRLATIRDRILRLPGRTIGFAGAIDRERAERLARGLLPPADPRQAGVDLAPALLPLRELASRAPLTLEIPRLTQVFFGLTRESVPLQDPAYPAFVLASHVLGGHFYSRLSVALRHQGGETYGAFTLADEDLAPGVFAAVSFTRAENAGHAEAKLEQTVLEFARSGISEGERRDAVSSLLGRAAFDRETPMQVLERRVRERRLGLAPGHLDRVAESAAALGLDEINAFVREFFAPSRARMVRVAPP